MQYYRVGEGRFSLFIESSKKPSKAIVGILQQDDLFSQSQTAMGATILLVAVF